MGRVFLQAFSEACFIFIDSDTYIVPNEYLKDVQKIDSVHSATLWGAKTKTNLRI